MIRVCVCVCLRRVDGKVERTLYAFMMRNVEMLGAVVQNLFTKKLDVKNENVCTWLKMPSAMPNSIDSTFVCFSIWHWFYSAFGSSSFDMDDWTWLSSNFSKFRYFDWFSGFTVNLFIKYFNCIRCNRSIIIFQWLFSLSYIVDSKWITKEKRKTLSMKGKSHVTTWLNKKNNLLHYVLYRFPCPNEDVSDFFVHFP